MLSLRVPLVDSDSRPHRCCRLSCWPAVAGQEGGEGARSAPCCLREPLCAGGPHRSHRGGRPRGGPSIEAHWPAQRDSSWGGGWPRRGGRGRRRRGAAPASCNLPMLRAAPGAAFMLLATCPFHMVLRLPLTLRRTPRLWKKASWTFFFFFAGLPTSFDTKIIQYHH